MPTVLAFDAPLAAHQQQAVNLEAAFSRGDHDAAELVRRYDPRFRDPEVAWLARPRSAAEVLAAGLTPDQARLVVARLHCFRDWAALSEYAAAASVPGSPVHRFESAVEAVVNGHRDELAALLRQHPELIRARSTRILPHDPPVHRATLLHYIGANGVENHRQRTPANALEITRLLLDAGAEPDALASLYGGECTTMSMLVSSCHPAQAGLRAQLAELLIDYGAAVTPRGDGNWTNPIRTALAFGYADTAETLARRGAPVDELELAAGLGRLDLARQLLPAAGGIARHRALAMAAQLGHAPIVELLLDAGEDPNRFNPEGLHAHSTPLHQAAFAGHAAVVGLLASRGARLDIEDKLWHGTPLGWAHHGGQTKVEDLLRSLGARG